MAGDLWELLYQRDSADRDDDAALRGLIAPGKQTLTELLPRPRGPAVQRQAAAVGAARAPAAAVDDPCFFATGGAQAIAAAGVAGPGTALPHREAVQRAFAHHDLGGVRAHVGGAAAVAAGALGATAYATGSDLAFAEAPSLERVAHEAAHVVQQRRGVALAGGLGRDGDPYERHADEVAAAVGRGESAAALLDAGPAGGAGGAAIQRQVTPRDATPATSPPTAASLTQRLTAITGVADEPTARAIVDDLRRIAPVTTDAAPLRAAIEAHLGGDARWRADNLVTHGPEDRWPPALRRNTVVIASSARELARQGRPATEVADALRPLDATAQQQILRSWRRDGGAWTRPVDPATSQPMTSARYFDAIQAALRGPSFAPVDAPGTAPTLDLEERLARGEVDAVYDYFVLVYRTLGFEFHETAANAASPTINVCNIRRHDLTRTAVAAHGPRTAVSEMNGQVFRIWRDGNGRRHVVSRLWSTTGPGASKLGDTRRHRDTVMRDAHLATSADDRHGVAASTETDPVVAMAEAEREVGRAEGAAAAAYAGSARRANAAATTTESQLAMELARHADRLAAEAPRVHPAGGRGRPPRPDPALGSQATALRARARQAFERARDAWVIARQQDLATAEESSFDALTAARGRLAALAATDPGRAAAQQEVDAALRDHRAARDRNNHGSNEGNDGEMSEMNGIAWLREGQYRAERVRVGEHWRYAVNGGGSGRRDGSGYAPADRDWNGNGAIDPGERDIPSTAIGSGVQIHAGSNPTASTGCQVAPTRSFDDLDDAVQHSADHSGFDYVLVEAERLPPWPAAAAGPTSGATPPTATTPAATPNETPAAAPAASEPR